MDYTDYWQLSDKPFENTRDSRFFFPSDNHSEALERMLYLTNDGNMHFGLLTGEIGSGKSLTKTVFERKLLGSNEYEVVSLENTSYSFKAILFEIISQLGEAKHDYFVYDEYALMKDFKEAIVKRISVEKSLRLVILLDEAQQMNRECLDRLKNLTNVNAESENYITIFLVGQPELRALVESLPQLDQRVSLRYHLHHLNSRDAYKYIRHRLRCSGHLRGDVFSQNAVKLIYRFTKGVPREINRICRLSLDASFAFQLKSVDAETVQRILEDFIIQSRKGSDLLKPTLQKNNLSSTKKRRNGNGQTAQKSSVPKRKATIATCLHCGKKGTVFFDVPPGARFICRPCKSSIPRRVG